ncbi:MULTISPECIES: cyclase family protein [Catenuloplanes]|uniref:Kynurenine formamidase n=1 Tax=Catenuloplanes niger TaxID=587534 RepID=A0AAE3ZJL1_9ACTN|nr:cyclase family protein [Catenuloplanes niger]MDR7320356.1 kynurenine formamidase [Catenuloplanes niger]
METFPTNWGRWGADDQLGAVNLITGEVRARAAAEARTGRTVSLARVSAIAPLTGGPTASMTAGSTGVQTVMMFTGDAPMAMAEVMIMTPHHPEITHLDGLSHMVVDGQVYPGIARSASSGPAGVRHGAADAFGDGILTRGVLLDLAPGGALPEHHAVTADDLDAAARRGGVEVRSGDALIVRGGWERATAGDRDLPGMTSGAVRWMHDHEISLYGGDIGDARPPIAGDVPGALHRLALTRLAIPLLDGVNAEALAAVCAELDRYTFMLVVGAPRIAGTTGLPVNPIAVF